MTEGPEAVDRLVRAYPRAGVFFGYGHLTPANFARVLDQWLTIEDAGCWLMLEGEGAVRTLHWFCPGGAHLPTLRGLLRYARDAHGVEQVQGEQPAAHPYRREARALARALGASRCGDRYVLTLSRLPGYTEGQS